MITQRVGRFRIESLLGEGGMASVWRAHDELLGREVALKVLADALASDPDARRRFRHEAQVAASLDHPGIAAVYESGESDGVTFIAMTLIEGETLSARVARSLLPVPEALRIAAAAAAALGHAHAQHVVHRDVTGRNIMLAHDGRVLVLDFGIALAQGVSRVTGPDTTPGTAAYMAPEVLSGGEAGPSADLYGLGVVLYEALTSRLPFRADHADAFRYVALNQRIEPPSAFRAELHPEVDRVVLRLLSRAPADRYASAEALIAELAALNAEPNLSPGPQVAARSVAADLLANAHGPVYLALAPFDVNVVQRGEVRDAARLARELRETLSAAVTELQRVHVVTDAGSPRPGEDFRAFARRAGVHLVLAGSLRVAGEHARITWRLVDPERGAQIAGGTLRGAFGDLFDLEDQLVTGVRKALGIPAGEESIRLPESASHPAAAQHFDRALAHLRRWYDESAVDGAIALLERQANANTHDARVYAALAQAYLAKFTHTRQHVWEGRAATALERAVGLDPDLPGVLLALGESNLAAGHSALAIRNFERALASHPEMFEAQLGVARAHEAAGRYDVARVACEAAVALADQDWRGHMLLGIVCFKRGEFADAMESWRRVLQLTPDNARAASNLGSALFHMDRHDDAIAAYRRSLQLQPNELAFTNLGTVLFYLERYDEAAAAFEQAVALTPSNPLMWGNLGDAARLVRNGAERAREASERASGLMLERLERNPEDADGWSRLAGWFVTLGRIDEARQAVKRALEGAPNNVHVMVRAGNVLCELGEREEAFKWLERAIRAGFGADAIRHAPDLAPIRDDPRFARLLDEAHGANPIIPRFRPTEGGRT